MSDTWKNAGTTHEQSHLLGTGCLAAGDDVGQSRAVTSPATPAADSATFSLENVPRVEHVAAVSVHKALALDQPSVDVSLCGAFHLPPFGGHWGGGGSDRPNVYAEIDRLPGKITLYEQKSLIIVD